MPVGIIDLGIPQCPFLHFAKSGVQVTSASGKSRLASVGRIFKFRGTKSPQTVDTKGFQPMASILFAGSGGDGEIRTLDTLLRYTRFPIVRARPATRHLQMFSIYILKGIIPVLQPKVKRENHIFHAGQVLYCKWTVGSCWSGCFLCRFRSHQKATGRQPVDRWVETRLSSTACNTKKTPGEDLASKIVLQPIVKSGA